ncbi:hypothetical protein GCM10022408_25860 [Hymenobacter fastidiosus]|uniref:DUF2157 domain-containing protein n=1 Tax=Hymenobacter fastidiosus TaxID=486264 RepID=A0ABP7SI92_9BACT
MNRKAYNEQGIFNRLVQPTVRRWCKSGLISAEQAQAIRPAFASGFYRPHLFVRIALFLFTGFAGLAASSLVFLFVNESLTVGNQAFELRLLPGCLIAGAGAYFLLEQLIRTHHLYRSGTDNALLYLALGYWLTALGLFYGIVFRQALDFDLLMARGLLALLLLPGWLLLLAAVVRYADPLVSVGAYGLYLVIIAVFTLQFSLGKALLPFVLMLAAAGSYQLVRRLTRRSDYLYYRTCLRIAKALSLGCFYLGGNYLVVREANAALNDLPTSIQISFAPLFYLFTAAIPLVYLTLGLRRADRIFLCTGLLTLAFSLYTYRFYRQLLPPEWALTLGGALLVLLAGGAMRYLRTPKHGLTAEPADRPDPELLNLESLALAHVAESGRQVPEPGFRFGGGSSGGGGAEGRY